MSKNLVIVESPTKCKALKKYLGKDFEVLASYGHVRDLLPKEGAVDTKNDFAMRYEPIEKNAKHVAAIAKALKKAEHLYLATDPDREGEAISWHLVEMLKEEHALDSKPVHRVVFYQITKNAVLEAMKSPRDISLDLVHAQQARRALDYLVGFTLSPLLWKKVRTGLSAGRVQSPALRLIVEREIEIEAFKSQEYWTITSDGKVDHQVINTRLIQYDGKKVEQFTITNEKQAQEVQKTLTKAANGKLVVVNVEKKQRKRQPSAPFITSTLQQEASRKLGFTADRTMRIAQQLYEGIDVGAGVEGLITYMRTDSVNLAGEALSDIRALIESRYGKDNLPDGPRLYKTKSKNAQEAHEAIRPSQIRHIPEEIKSHLSPEQFKLYQLIWQRTVACQMIHATMNVVTIDFSCGEPHRMRASGSTIAHPGFLSVYQEGLDDQQGLDSEEDRLLPPLKEGDVLSVNAFDAHQHFTEPPPRFSEASLIKTLEEHGIGRPSTYASIIYTLKNREYVNLDQKRFYPTDVGRVVNKFLTEYFTQYVDYGFTAALEDELDAVSRGEKEWRPVLKEFWVPFDQLVHKIEETVQRKDVTQEQLDENCPKCGKPLSKRLGRRGVFIGCTGFPECDYTRSLDGESDSTTPAVVEGRKCPECGSDLVIKQGRYGKFIGCSGYPNCKHMEPLEKPEDTGVECPECKQAKLLKRKSRYGKIFYSCQRYPDCKYAVWDLPLDEACPKCHWPILTLKTTKRRGTEKVCPQKECGFRETIEPPEPKSK